MVFASYWLFYRISPTSAPFHVQERIGIPLFVEGGPLVGHKPQMLVKADGLRILLVDGELGRASGVPHSTGLASDLPD